MKDLYQISDSELEVMKVLWEIGPATSAQIVDKLKDRVQWKSKTIQTLITRLISKKAIKGEKINGKNYIYIVNIKEEEYRSEANSSFLKKLYNGSINMFMASFIKEKKLSKDNIEELKKLLDEED